MERTVGCNLHRLRPLGIALLASLVVSLGACAPNAPQSTSVAAGPVSRMQLNLFMIIFWAAVFVFVTVEGMLLFTIIRFRRKPQQGMPAQVHGNTPLEIVWTIIPAIILVVIAVPTIQAIGATETPPPGEVLKVTVTGHQWWWEFEYPDFKIVTANEMHIPVGRTVSLTLESADVIHSFWVPKLAGKIDMIPTRQNHMWLAADKPGVYSGQCAEFCGTAHAHMRFSVVAETQEEFDAWVKAQQKAAGPAIGEAARGAQVFATSSCVACHTIEGTPWVGRIGPNLTHFGSRSNLAAGALESDASGANLSEWLRDPPAVKPGAKMPNLNLTEEQISALVAYLESLK